MRLSTRRIITATLGVALLAGPAVATASAAPDASAARSDSGRNDAALRQAMSDMVAGGVAGVQVRVHDDQGDWAASAGVRELGGDRRPPTDGRFRIGSVTKTFVATVVLQLVSEGRVGLDTPVDRYLPGLLPAGDRTTVRMILQHTSGLYSYSDDLPIGEGATQIKPEFLRVRFRHFDPEQLVGMATAKPLLFEPGSQWSYSDTNYIVAGLLIKAVTGRAWGTEVTGRIIRPLGLHGTSVPGDDPTLPWPNVRGYAQLDGAAVDVTELNPSMAGAAGSMISTTADVNRFFGALLGGTKTLQGRALLAPAQLAEMRRTRPVAEGVDFGLGILRITTPCGTAIWGHTGGIPGYATTAFTTADGRRQTTISVTTNKNPQSGSETRMLFASFCP
ncbi:serine hydrolase domain-containing protein [Solihabitans fulvus]|nr:serine hydrolase domain-containing protein [Solihabitans fulvus]